MGTNISIISIFLSNFGIYSLFSSQHLKKINNIYIFFSVFWLFNSSGRYYFQPGKLGDLLTAIMNLIQICFG